MQRTTLVLIACGFIFAVGFLFGFSAGALHISAQYRVLYQSTTAQEATP